MAGCIAAGIYTTNSADSCKYVTETSKSSVIVLEDNKQLAKFAEFVGQISSVKAIVVWNEKNIDKSAAEACRVPVFSWQDFMTLGNKINNESVDKRSANIKPGNCSTLIYTSGTTGPPKAVMISHDNVTWTTRNIAEHYMDLTHQDRIVSYLPLSHIAAQILDIHAVMSIGGATYFAQQDALKGSLAETLKEVRPTVFFGVPRVWEKMHEKMVQIGRKNSGIKAALASWAKSVGAEHTRRMEYGNGGGIPSCYSCANALILSKVKAALGLDQAKGCFSAAAPIAVETIEYFASLDIPIFEVFGQSECTGPHTVSGEKAWRVGYCGRPIPGTESKLLDTGEVCYRGRHIFMGYMFMEDKTNETFDKDGYLLSGDIAEFDDNDDPNIPKPSGFMKITGRIKDLIITAGGENIPPSLIESEMKAAMNAVSNCVIIGDKRKFLSMLVSLKVKPDKQTGLPSDELDQDSLFACKEIGSDAKTYSDAKKDPLWKKYIDEGMKAANKKTTSRAQVVQKWTWLPEDFSEKNGDLTPTLKVKRNVVLEKNSTLIQTMYE